MATLSVPYTVGTNTTHLSSPKVSVDSNGNAMVVWVKTDPATSSGSVQSSSYSVASGTWNMSLPIDQGTSSVFEAAFSMDGQGNAEVVWFDSAYKLYERRFDAKGGTGWGAFNIMTPSSYNLLLDMSDSGYGVLWGHGSQAYSWVYTP